MHVETQYTLTQGLSTIFVVENPHHNLEPFLAVEPHHLAYQRDFAQCFVCVYKYSLKYGNGTKTQKN